MHEQRETSQEMWLVPEEGKAGSIVRIVGKPLLSESGSTYGYMLVIHDITISKWAEKRLEVSEQRFKSLYDHNPDIVFWFDLHGRLLSANPAAQRITDFSQQELRDKTIEQLLGAIGSQHISNIYAKVREGNPLHEETTVTHSNGSTLYLQSTFIPIMVDGQLVGIYVISQDITSQKQALETIRRIAYFDSLTGLPNRHHFFELLTDTIVNSTSPSIRDVQSFALLFVDLDRFKWINDTLGHLAGDLLLEQTAARMKQCIGTRGVIARLSGDEFIVLLYDALGEEAQHSAQQLIEAVASPVFYENNHIHTTISIGISLYPEHGSSAEELIQFADIAMYRVKERGKNGFQLFDSEMNAAMVRRAFLENEMRKAIHDQQFTLHYQPQTDARNGKISGFEALVRWQHPGRGLVSPLEFIPLAEETGLITALGEWVLRQACVQLKRWIKEGFDSVTMAVNISMKQFQDDHLFTMIETILKETELDPALLELEITESIGLQGADQVINKLFQLKSLGIRIAIDDFGTGYSSLHYLRKLPLDTLKIDKSFIRDMMSETKGSSIVHSIIELAHSLQLDVLAEGVEKTEQLEKLVSFGCDRLQGYLFSPPIPPEQVHKLLFPPQTGDHSSF
ncbi:sensor domain-containing protein [Paenibacillus sp. YIM B09110]|uniref:sensor domain-containing protein n=1 Tax=Paenibacillus sp. YIM B09110 TaxID=3126102 RepID=UPI00301D1CF9